jgi:HIRAN domain
MSPVVTMNALSRYNEGCMTMNRRVARSSQERRRPEDEFDFMVAGVNFEGRHRIIDRYLNVGDRVRIALEPDNPHDECAVAVTLIDGRKIGYVPCTDSEDVTDSVGDGGYYVASVKKILTGGQFPVPVIVLQFYRPDQLAGIVDSNPDLCSTAATPVPALFCCVWGLGYVLTLPFRWLVAAIGILALWLGRVASFTVTFMVTAIWPLALGLGKGSHAAVTGLVEWVASVKEDLRGTKKHELNPVSLIGKLLVVAAVSAVLIILLVNLVLFALSRTR